MTNRNKDLQLQIRVSPREKAMIIRAAKQAGMSMSAWLLARALPPKKLKFRELLDGLRNDEHNRYVYAALNDLLTELSPSMFREVVSEDADHRLTPYAQNYLAAMVELAAAQKGVIPPDWTRNIIPLMKPHFGITLTSLRLHLLTQSPAVFRRRNIFIDATLGHRV